MEEGEWSRPFLFPHLIFPSLSLSRILSLSLSLLDSFLPHVFRRRRVFPWASFVFVLFILSFSRQHTTQGTHTSDRHSKRRSKWVKSRNEKTQSVSLERGGSSIKQQQQQQLWRRKNYNPRKNWNPFKFIIIHSLLVSSGHPSSSFLSSLLSCHVKVIVLYHQLLLFPTRLLHPHHHLSLPRITGLENSLVLCCIIHRWYLFHFNFISTSFQLVVPMLNQKRRKESKKNPNPATSFSFINIRFCFFSSFVSF